MRVLLLASVAVVLNALTTGGLRWTPTNKWLTASCGGCRYRSTALLYSGDGDVSPRAATIAPKVVESLKDFLSNQPLEKVISIDDFQTMMYELNGNAAFWEQNRPLFEGWWAKLDKSLRSEKRPLKQILGEKPTTTLLKSVEGWNIYEPGVVKAFLSNAAFENMIGGILYEGIFEFIKKFDFIGNIVDKIPVLGPIRQVVLKEFKNQLDRTLGPQVKTFLSGGFNRIAVQRMIEFILSPTNRASLQKAQRSVVQSLFERPLGSIMPGEDTSDIVRDRVWAALVQAPNTELVALTEALYGKVASNTVQDFADVEDLLEVSPTLKRIFEVNVGRFLDTEDGVNLMKDIAIVALTE